MKLSLYEILKAERELAASRPVPKTQWERILVPVDFSENSREALKLAVTLAADPEDRITLLHVVEPDHPWQRGNEVMMTLSKSDAEIRFEAEKRLERWAAQEAGPDIEVETAVRTGGVAEEILALAESRDCDLIVLANEPPGWLKRLLSTSLTAQIQRKAACAVICIRPPTAVESSHQRGEFTSGSSVEGSRRDEKTSDSTGSESRTGVASPTSTELHLPMR